MSFAYVVLLLLLPIGGIAYLLWDHKRKTAARNAASESRMQELLGLAQAQPNPDRTRRTDLASGASTTAPAPFAATAAPAVTPAPAHAPAPMPFTAAPAAPAAPAAVEEALPAALYAVRDRVLTPPQTLLYYLLKTGMPDHVVFARASLASILEAGPGLSGFAREEQSRRLSALTVDFVVCDREMHPLAAVILGGVDEGSVAQSDRASVRTRLAAAGVRYIELDAKALPRKDAIRAVVLENAVAADSAAEKITG